MRIQRVNPPPLICSINSTAMSLRGHRGEKRLQAPWEKENVTRAPRDCDARTHLKFSISLMSWWKLSPSVVAAVAEWYRYRTVACLVTSSSPVPLKTRRVGQRCTINLSRAETSSRWCGVVVRRGGASSGVVHVT
ncbi:uncharacterized protein TNCV_1665411 [Trichonephila clavipes]|nr:uncharacterized protein TNCV_1665411 [Trichonephila clavipes]